MRFLGYRLIPFWEQILSVSSWLTLVMLAKKSWVWIYDWKFFDFRSTGNCCWRNRWSFATGIRQRAIVSCQCYSLSFGWSRTYNDSLGSRFPLFYCLTLCLWFLRSISVAGYQQLVNFCGPSRLRLWPWWRYVSCFSTSDCHIRCDDSSVRRRFLKDPLDRWFESHPSPTFTKSDACR